MTAAGVLAPTAAHAATTSIRWEQWGNSTLEPSDEARICTPGSLDFLEQGQTVVVQVLLGGVWTTKEQIVVGQWERCVSVTPSELVSGPGTHSFRAQFRPAPAAAVLSTSITYKLVTESSYADWADESDLFSLTTTPHRSLDLGMAPARGQAVDVQRKWNGNWVTVSRATAPTGGGVEDMAIAVPTRAGTGTYRTVVRATAWSTQGISAPFTIHQTDYARHKSYLTSARQYMARFCPSTPIYIDTPDVLPGNPYNRIGQATGWWWTAVPGSPGSLETRIELRSGMTGLELKSVALHECAHIVQYRAVVEDKRDLEMQRAWNLWRTTGDEGQADCMQYVFTKSTRYFGYVRSCTSTQVANATRMWQDYGLEYQANPYYWSVGAGAASGTPERGTEVRSTGSGTD